MPPLFILGRYPPPLDGQTLATRRLAELLEGTYDVRRIDTSPPDTAHVAAEVKLRPARVWYYLRGKSNIREALGRAPGAPVLWASISPARLGHWRDLLATVPAFGVDRKVYAVLHRGTFDRLFRDPLTARTARRLVRRTAGFVFLNEQLAAECAPWIPDAKRFVIPNTIDAEVACTAEEVARKQADRASRPTLRLLFLSNMLPEKGYRDVLEAARLLRARGASFTLHFAGGWVSDADRQAFDAFVRTHGLGGVVSHEGPVADRRRIKALHLAADAFLLPSYHPTEAQPLALIEALNAGTPVIVTRNGGLPEMVREGREGFLLPPQDPAALAKAVLRLYDQAVWLACSSRTRERYDAYFSPERVRRAWLDLLERA